MPTKEREPNDKSEGACLVKNKMFQFSIKPGQMKQRTSEIKTLSYHGVVLTRRNYPHKRDRYMATVLKQEL